MTLAKSAVVRQRVIEVVVCPTRATGQQQLIFGQQEPTSASLEQGSQPEAREPQSAQEIHALVAPLALYPDALVASRSGSGVLRASSEREQSDQGMLLCKEPAKLMKEVDKHSWHPSAKALKRFPSVLGVKQSEEV
jgi:hypothetical protein